MTGLVAHGRATGLAGLTGVSPQDAVAVGVLAVVVGVEVTATAVCNAVRVILDQPGQWERIGREPGLVDAAVREALRLVPPLRFDSRIVRERVELDGKTIEEGRRVVVLIDAANRDPDAFADPNMFDPGRADGDRALMPLGGVAAPVAETLVWIQTQAAIRVLTELRPGLHMTAEVPQVALGWMWDAIYRAQRIEELGAGLHLPSDGLSADVLRAKLVRVLDDPSFSHGARRLRRAVLSTPSPNEVVPTLEKLTARHRSAPVAR
ncbi:cytochrome P450 [Streptomyces sp. ST2-7A]|uniref:cytochrome P450 n=1 Tax=Streptomyces sp. ST2-7A TaxID=2907214 RepID=UPI001F19A2B3|nr:cytochrome P450 [Streptomyces sp. ST2-7A]MCE7079550.1 cytochrome P450 [Streptomyces sp. ST2-7A]